MSTEPDRRLVTVLVTDIVDSTPIAERLGAERYKTLFDEIARLMRDEVERFGGTVVQHTGDGILAAFGAPIAHEDDSDRAVRAALAIHAALAPFGAEVAAAYGVAIAARAAVNTGPALVLRGDEPADQLYNALGDTVTVAARLQSHAGAGGTIVGPLTATQVRRLYELDDLGDIELKGRVEPVAACLVLGERPEHSDGQLTPFVGRDAEIRALVGAMTELGEGRGTVVILHGEPGIGKSRLVAEARDRVGDAVRFLEGSAVAYAETFPYWSIRGLMRDWLGVGAGASDAVVRLESKTALARVLPDAATAYPFVAAVVGAPLDPTEAQALAGLTSDSVRRQTVEAVRDIVVALSRELPLCLVVDDLHWADESTLDLLDDLLAVTEGHAVGILLLSRSEREHGSWRLGETARQRLPHRLTEIDLEPLDGAASRALLGEAAGAQLPAAVEELLAERAGGNPFFLEEAFRDLAAQGAINRSSGSYEVAVEIDRLAVPLLVQEALQARLDRLAPATRDLVGVASVVGRSFASPLLELLVPDEPLAPLLGELQRLELIVEERRRPVPEYRFRHGLVQEVAYASLPEQRRTELHRRTAAALATLHGATANEIAGLLAYHQAEGGELASAARWSERAGDAARARYANEEAASHYAGSVELYDAVGDGAAARHVLFKIGIGHVLAFEFAAAAMAYRAAFSRPVGPQTRQEPSEGIRVPLDRFDSIVPGHVGTNIEDWIASHLFRGLVRIDSELTVLPEVASEFEVSDDGLRYVFRLRPDVRWHDGMPVTARDFVWAWERVRERQTDAAFLLDPILAAEATDDLTLEVRLAEPSNTFLYVLGRPVSFPWPSHRGELRADTRDVVGNGPFALTKWDEERLHLTAQSDWPLQRGNVRDIEIDFFAAEDWSGRMWRGGPYDVAFGGWVEPGDGDPGDELELVRNVNFAYLAFKTTMPPFHDERIRRAVAFGLDRDRLCAAPSTTYGFVHVPATRTGLIPPALAGHVHDVGVSHDPERARSLLAEAGYPDGRGMPELTVLAPYTGSRWDSLDDELRRQFRELGLQVQIERLPGFAAFERALPIRGHMYLMGHTLDVPDPSSVFEALLAPGAEIYCDDELLALLAEARSTRNRDERLRLFGELDRAVVADRAAVVPLYYMASYLARRPWVTGVWSNGYDDCGLDKALVDTELRRRAPSTPSGGDA